MNKYLLTTILFLITFFVFAQHEGVYDEVYLKNGKVLTGKIIIFQESDGDITFKDIEGNTYSLTRKEYKSFRENAVYINKKNPEDTISIRPRKADQIGGSIGLSSGQFLYDDISFLLYGGIGKYFTRKTYVGISGEYAIVSSLDTYVNTKGFINYQYDAYKKNISPYIIGELGYVYAKGDLPVEYSNSQLVPVFQKSNFINVGFGHGVNFYLRNSNSVSLELLIARNEGLNRQVLSRPSGYLGVYNKEVGKPSYNSFLIRLLINI